MADGTHFGLWRFGESAVCLARPCQIRYNHKTPYGIRWAIVQWQDPGFWSARRARESCWPSHLFENETAFGRFFVALLVYALILAHERFVLGGIRPPSRRSANLKNKKPSFFATFLRLGTPLCSRKAEKSRHIAIFAAFLGLNPRLRKSRQSLIAKKLQSGAIFCFWASGPDSRRCLGWDA